MDPGTLEARCLMACPTILTGDAFLTRVVTHIDCQAQALGSYGFQSLSQPGSLASNVMLSLLTIFVALFAIRLLFGPAPGARDVVGDVVKIGIVLTLAFSWPAFRTLIYDLTLNGPAQIAAAIAPATLADVGSGFLQRLQRVDTAIIELTSVGTGRTIGQFVDPGSPEATFRGQGLADEETFGTARLFFLSGIIGSLALLRVIAGLLLAIAPLAAGLLLFEQTRGLFAGWLRGLVLALVGSLGVTILLAFELALLEPWLADALRIRSLGYAAPSSPTELLALTLAFAVAQLALVFLLAWIAFHRGAAVLKVTSGERRSDSTAPNLAPLASMRESAGMTRAQRISDTVEIQMRRENLVENNRISFRSLGTDRSASTGPSSDAGFGSGSSAPAPAGPPRLGSSYRRTSYRRSVAASSRDAR
ncbi:type IV secretion system protein [Qipengyuania sp. DSG2-2]|uniref:type IV secretion system protein n=1 Tax=Qipengyuania sp. DGS2-2 TaxID=3349631 RepID=UPI0036D29292